MWFFFPKQFGGLSGWYIDNKCISMWLQTLRDYYVTGSAEKWTNNNTSPPALFLDCSNRLLADRRTNYAFANFLSVQFCTQHLGWLSSTTSFTESDTVLRLSSRNLDFFGGSVWWRCVSAAGQAAHCSVVANCRNVCSLCVLSCKLSAINYPAGPPL